MTVISFPNSHLVYAITWFSFPLAALSDRFPRRNWARKGPEVEL